MAQDTFMYLNGYQWAFLAAAFSVIGGGIGSCMGIASAAKVAAGVMSEDPSKFGGLLVLCILPGTQGIYGFITALLVVIFFKLLGGEGAAIGATQGFRVFLACMPVAVVCWLSAVYQGLVSAAGAAMVGKRGETVGQGMIFAALVETYAVLSLVVTLFLLMIARNG
ncbi:MAG: V-type ATP synthase subunit K [Actinomycetota bacterium]|nr:V-type ATP synthase subunit K [Actinomycetota bacterium]